MKLWHVTIQLKAIEYKPRPNCSESQRELTMNKSRREHKSLTPNTSESLKFQQLSLLFGLGVRSERVRLDLHYNEKLGLGHILSRHQH